jgi:hypothetical protein
VFNILPAAVAGELGRSTGEAKTMYLYETHLLIRNTEAIRIQTVEIDQ